jgi:hypothetical protein
MNDSVVKYRLTFNSKVKYDQNIIRPHFLHNIFFLLSRFYASKAFSCFIYLIKVKLF